MFCRKLNIKCIFLSLFLQDLNPWIPYVNIGLIFCVICIYGLGPCKFPVTSSPPEKKLLNIVFIHFYFILFKLECLWLFLLTSSYKHGVLLLMWSVGLSTGLACSSWRCCSATLWWETYYVSFVISNNSYIILYLYFDYVFCVSNRMH